MADTLKKEKGFPEARIESKLSEIDKKLDEIINLLKLKEA